MNFPEQLHYTKEHEWISIDGNVATIGITEFAQGELGDIIYVDIETIGKELGADAVFGVPEPPAGVVAALGVAAKSWNAQ